MQKADSVTYAIILRGLKNDEFVKQTVPRK